MRSLEPVEITLAGHLLRAVSWAGVETCIELPGWKLCFDIGRCPPSATRYDRVLFTHGHVDHLGGIAHHCGTRAMRRMSVPTYVLPEEHHGPVERLMAAWREVDRSDLPCVLLPVRPGNRVDLGRGREAVAFRAVHRVPTLGYALRRAVRRLRPEFAGLPGSEIARRRERGEQLTEVEQRVEVAFCGDTTIDVVEREPLVRQARLLVLECTFLDDAVSLRRARQTGHVHLDELVARAELFHNEAILLTHFSTRYPPDKIRRLLDRRLPPGLRERVHPLLPSA